MAIFCPTLSNPEVKQDFTNITDIAGEDGAYFLWNKYEGDMTKIMDHLASMTKLVTEPLIPKTDPYEKLKFSRPSAKFTAPVARLASNAKMNVNKYEQDRWDNNKSIWEVEKRYGLSTFRDVDGQLFKVFTPMTKVQADKIEKDIRATYIPKMGTASFTFERVESGDGNTKKVGLRIGGWYRDPFANDLMTQVEEDIQIEVALLRMEGGEDIAPLHKEQRISLKTSEDLEKIRDANALLKPIVDAYGKVTRPVDPYGFLQTLQLNDPNSRALIDSIVANKENNPNLKVKVVDREDAHPDALDALMYFDTKENTIYVIEEASLSPVANTYDFYANAMLHEFVHSFTVRAMLDPSSSQDKEFRGEMLKLWRLAKKNAKNKDMDGLNSPEEFVADLNTDAELINELKKMPYNIWTRILNAIGRFLGIAKWAEYGTAYQKALDTLMRHIGSETTFDMVTMDKDVILKKKASVKDTFANSNSIRNQIFELRRTDAENPNFGEKLGKLLRTYHKEFRTDKDNSVTHKTSLRKFMSVTNLMDQYGYAFDAPEGSDLEAAGKRGADLGNMVHNMSETIIEGTKVYYDNDSGFKTTSGMRKDMEDIIATIRQPGDRMMVAEVDVYSPHRGIHGKIDLIRMDKHGKIHIYDFKTKEKGFGGFENRFPNAEGALKYSDQQRAHTQMTLYKRMWEDLTNMSVSSMNVIMVKPTVNKAGEITKVTLDNQHNAFGIDTILVDSRYGAQIFEDLATDFNSKSESILDSTPGNDIKNVTLRIENYLRTASYKSMETARLENVINSTIRNLEGQIKNLRRTKATARADALQEKVDELKRSSSISTDIEKITKIAKEEGESIMRAYIASLKDGKIGENIDIRQLKRWKQVMESYSDLYEYAKYLKSKLHELKLDPEKNKANIEGWGKIVADIEEVATLIHDIGDLYTSATVEKLVTFLEPNFNRVYAEYKETLRKAYNLKDKEFKKGMTLNQFIQDGMRDEAVSLRESTRIVLRTEILRASTDPNTLARWIENMLDSKDAMTASMVKSFAKSEWKSRQKAMDMKADLISLIHEVERVAPNTAFGDPRQIYGWMLETDEAGELTGHLVDSHNSALLNDYREFAMNEPDYEKREKWKNDRAPLNRNKYRHARGEYLKTLVKPITGQKAKMTEEEYTALLTFLAKRKKGWNPESNLIDLVNEGKLNEEVADLVSTWRYMNTWKYRELKPKYEKKYGTSKKWLQLQEWKKTGDARWKFYDFIRNMTEEANQHLPYSNRLGLRLPGVTNDFRERLKTGSGLVANFKESLNREFTVQADDIERDQEFIKDSKGNIKAFLPIHYTADLRPPSTEELTKTYNLKDEKYRSKVSLDTFIQRGRKNNQSYDIPTIFFKFWEMANDYGEKQEILPEMELAKYIIENRKTDKLTKPKGKLAKLREQVTGKEREENNNNLAKQLNDWFMTYMYGHPKKHQGDFKIFGLKFDTAKIADFMNKYTAFNLLGLNIMQGSANAILGEALQMTEAIAGEYITTKSYFRGTDYYMRNLPAMLADVGRRGKESVASLLMESYDAVNEPITEELGRATRVRQLDIDALHMFTKGGEHEMQGRFLFSTLKDKRMFDAEGKDIGNALDFYTAENGKLIFDKEDKVDEVKSEWTENDRFRHQFKVKGILSRIHGAYGALEKVAIQRGAGGRMAYMFRKFVEPGFKRRWGKRAYNERIEDFVEGNYRTTGEFFKSMFTNYQEFKMNLLAKSKHEWSNMSDMEKANIRRTISEVGFLVLAILMAKVALAALRSDDDDDEWNDRYYAFIAYQAARLKAELLFYVSPKETFSILRSPAASLSMAENVGKLFGHLTVGWGDVYERGPWKGKLKMSKTLNDMIPGGRQYYRVKNMKDQTSWFTDDIRVPEWMK